jgi:putative hydrolase
MSPDVPQGPGSFFEGMLGDLLRLLQTRAPLPWDVAVQLAQTIASDGASEPNTDPADRIRLEELLGVAELHVADVTGMPVAPGGRRLTILTTTRAEWARRSLEGWRPVLEQIATALRPPAGAAAKDEPAGSGEAGPVVEADEEAGLEGLLGQWMAAIAPAMVAMQVGSVVGHLAQRALGQYELPLPRPSTDELLVVPGNARQFAEDWSLPIEDLSLWLCVRDVALHSVLSRPHVRARIELLLTRQASGVRPDPKALEEHLAGSMPGGMGDLGDLTRLLGSAGAVARLEDTPTSLAARRDLEAITSAIEGYAEWVTDTVATRSIGGRSAIREAMRRRRVERGEDEAVAEALFGLNLEQEAIDRGESFVRGVLERGGEEELGKLWTVEANLPTPSELEAPGLWIERINLPPA